MKNKGSVLWITGLSCAGKTTVGRFISESLSSIGASVFWMDGDEMRPLLGNKWGYTVEERLDLAFVYSRIARKIAENGVIVICSVIAMFDEVRVWNRKNIDNYFEVFLRVPVSILAERDTKGNYAKYLGKEDPESVVSSMFQMPKNPNLVIDNFGVVSPRKTGRLILERFLTKTMGIEDDDSTIVHTGIRIGMEDYWNSYYRKQVAPEYQTPFAEFCKAEFIEDDKKILEIGCGNGRDSFYFAETNHVVAIDASNTAIERNNTLARKNNLKNLKFINGFFGESGITIKEKFDYIYSRFVLHTIDEMYEDSVIELSAKILKPGGLFMAEFRTTKDPLAHKGVQIGVNERITDHYRRFIDPSSIISKLNGFGFEIVFSKESTGFAKYKDEDPIVARIIARA